MNVLVTAASKHGSTAEIATVIGRELLARGVETAVVDPDGVLDLDDFDAVVLGSAVYAGHWLEPAKALVDRLGDQVAARPVWLFSSGPLGDPLRPDEDPVDVAPISETVHARGHRLFPGRLDRARLTFGEKAMVMALRAPEGDFRDWDAVAGWAAEIAGALERA